MYENEIRETLQSIAILTRKKYSAELRKIGLHIGQELALFHLWKNDGITQSDLKHKTGSQASTVSNMLRKLEEDKIIYRKADKNDNRATRVFLTDKGYKLKAPVEKIWQLHEENLFKGISQASLSSLRHNLKKMEENLSADLS